MTFFAVSVALDMGRYMGWINEEYGFWDAHKITAANVPIELGSVIADTDITHTAQKRHRHDPDLSDFLVSFFKDEADTVADFGCGNGSYLSELHRSGIKCVGYDGNQETERHTNGLGKSLNLAKKIDVDVADWILTLEVAEHIPKKYEEVFIDNVHRHNRKGVVISWAVKGQGGYGHFNEQDNDYVKDLFCNLGYTNDMVTEKELREVCSLERDKAVFWDEATGWTLPCRYFVNTLMVFRKV